MPDPAKKTATKTTRDLSKPLGESKFDPADANKDGSVSVKEQKQYNKVQKLKQKGAESLKDRNARRGKTTAAVASAAGTVLTLAEQAKKVFKKSPTD